MDNTTRMWDVRLNCCASQADGSSGKNFFPSAYRSRVRRIERVLDGRSKGRRVIFYCVPDRFEIHPILLRHDTSGTMNGASRPSRTAASPITRSFRSTAAIVFGSWRNASNVMTLVNASVIEIPSRMSRSGSSGCLKGKHRLAGRAFFNGFFQHLGGRQIYRHAHDFREADFETCHVQQSQASG